MSDRRFRHVIHLRSSISGIVLLLLAGCARPEISAHWRDREFEVDGELADWSGLQVAPYGDKLHVGTANDAQTLYLSVSTTDRELIESILRHGLTVWFDPAGGDEQTLGFRIPARRQGFGEPNGLPPRGRGAPRGRTPRGGDSRRGRESGTPPIEPGQKAIEFELLGPLPGLIRRVTSPGDEHVQVVLEARTDLVVVEARLPLAAPSGWALGVTPGDTLGIGWEVEPGMPARPDGRSGPPGRGDRGGPPPPGGGGPGGFGRPNGSGMPPPPGKGNGGARWSKWAKLRLAVASDSER